MKFTVKREKWYRGNGHSNSSLLNGATGNLKNWNWRKITSVMYFLFDI